MAAKLDRKLFTAKFKRDYVAFSAVAIFVLIVFGEVALAISIPVYFVRSNLWNLQIARQGLMSHFDSVRRTASRAKIRARDAVEENNIILWNLNLMANYLRYNAKNIQMDEIRSLEQDLTKMEQIVGRLKQERPYNRSARLRTEPLLEAMARQLNGGKLQ